MTRRDPGVGRVGIVGMGYMGLTSGLAFAAHGVPVVGFDVSDAVRASVGNGQSPYREPGLEALLRAQIRSSRFRVVASLEELVESAEGLFLCVPTPSRLSGRIDLGPLRRSVREVGTALRPLDAHRVVVVKSTVVPGTTEGVVAPLLARVARRTPPSLGVASNPEFLAEGTMVADALRPERIVLGTSDPVTLAWLRRLYRVFHRPIVELSPSGAELVKYASNSFLALKVSFANEVARLSDRLGVHVDRVMDAVGDDPRIGRRFLSAGPGFGGSCFDKDVRALATRARDLGLRFRSGEASLQINDEQLAYTLGQIRRVAGAVRGERVALLGLAFKEGTDDVRESRALGIARGLVADGAAVRAHDPAARETFRRAWSARPPTGPGRLDVVDTVEEALAGTTVAVLQAAWPEYLKWPRAWSSRMARPLLVDLRRAVTTKVARRAGLTVIGLGAGDPLPPGSGSYGPRSGA